MRVVISEWFDVQALPVLSGIADVIYQSDLHLSPERLRHYVTQADALIVRNQTQVDGLLLSSAKKLKVVGRLGSGLNNLQLEELAKRNIPVVYAPDAATCSVAEHCVALMLALARHLPQALQVGRSTQWRREMLLGRDLQSKRLGLIGFGRIAQRLAVLAQVFGMQVNAWSPGLLSGKRERIAGVRAASFSDVLEQSHFISLHLPLTSSTIGLMDREAFFRMNRGAYFINTSRGEIVDENALVEALSSGWLAGAALDVRAEEPPKADSILNRLPNCLLTPHIAAMTHESQLRCCMDVAEDVARVLSGKSPHFPVPIGHV